MTERCSKVLYFWKSVVKGLSSAFKELIFLFSKSILPLRGVKNPAIKSSSVDLPLPLSPITPIISFLSTCKEKS